MIFSRRPPEVENHRFKTRACVPQKNFRIWCRIKQILQTAMQA
jgi:hypothetical protein